MTLDPDCRGVGDRDESQFDFVARLVGYARPNLPAPQRDLDPVTHSLLCVGEDFLRSDNRRKLPRVVLNSQRTCALASIRPPDRKYVTERLPGLEQRSRNSLHVVGGTRWTFASCIELRAVPIATWTCLSVPRFPSSRPAGQAFEASEPIRLSHCRYIPPTLY